MKNLVTKLTLITALLTNFSAYARTAMILGSGIESRVTGEKIHLVATDLDSSGKPRYVQFQYTDAFDQSKLVGPSLLVHGEVAQFIRSFAIYNKMTKDPHQRRKFQVTRALLTKNNVRVGGEEWNAAINIGGGGIGIKLFNELIRPQSTGEGLAVYLLGVLSAPLIVDLISFPVTAIMDALDPSLKFPFADDLEPLDATNRENWLLRTDKISGKYFANFLNLLNALPVEPQFERLPMPGREPEDQPRQCYVKWGKVSVDLRLPLKADLSYMRSGNTEIERARSRANRMGNEALYRLSHSNGYVTPKNAQKMIPWIASGGIFKKIVGGKANVCVRVVYDSIYANDPISQEECRELGKKPKKNYALTQELINAAAVKFKDPTCVDGVLELPNP